MVTPTKKGMIDGQFLYDHLCSISIQTPWFDDIENYLTARNFLNISPTGRDGILSGKV
jgi:hypothetical protein